jgi:hypothetical protein
LGKGEFDGQAFAYNARHLRLEAIWARPGGWAEVFWVIRRSAALPEAFKRVLLTKS